VKLKKFLFLSALFIALAFGVVILWPKGPLVNPLVSYKPELGRKLTQKIISDFKLDLSSAKEINTTVPHYMVFNLDNGQVYAAHGIDDKISPASFTKVLTAQVAYDLGYPDQLLTTSAFSTDKVPTELGLKVGEQLKLADLIRAAIATSANDAAATLAEATALQSGLDYADFIGLMNGKAILLSMNNSHFINPDGLDGDSQFTTIADLAKLVVNTYKNYPEIMAAAASDRQDIEKSDTHDFYYLSNWNGLLGVYPGVTGLKIAYTGSAGFGTIVTASREGVNLAAIVSGAASLEQRDLTAVTLLDEGYAANNIKRGGVTLTDLKKKYKIWDDLIRQTRAAVAAGH